MLNNKIMSYLQKYFLNIIVIIIINLSISFFTNIFYLRISFLNIFFLMIVSLKFLCNNMIFGIKAI